MLFQRNKDKEKDKANNITLPNKIKPHTKNRILQCINDSTVEGASGYTSFRGSMTVEAAVTLPLLLFAVYILWIFFGIMTIQVRLQTACEDVSGKLAQESYLLEEWASGTDDGSAKGNLAGMSEGISLSSMLSDVAWKSYAKSQIVSLVGADEIERSPIVSGTSGITLARSKWDRSGDIDLCLDYQAEVPVLLGIRWKMGFTQHSVRRCWTGSQSRQSAGDGEAEEMVYITDSGAVYHRDVSCYHLLLTIREVPAASVGSQRNGSGGSYTPCERCAVAVKTGRTVYIAKEGNRYHASRDCSGLKRSVTAVPKSQAGGRRPCSNCGGLGG